jgi:hypothetical protein
MPKEMRNIWDEVERFIKILYYENWLYKNELCKN